MKTGQQQEKGFRSQQGWEILMRNPKPSKTFLSPHPKKLSHLPRTNSCQPYPPPSILAISPHAPPAFPSFLNLVVTNFTWVTTHLALQKFPKTLSEKLALNQ